MPVSRRSRICILANAQSMNTKNRVESLRAAGADIVLAWLRDGVKPILTVQADPQTVGISIRRAPEDAKLRRRCRTTNPTIVAERADAAASGVRYVQRFEPLLREIPGAGSPSIET